MPVFDYKCPACGYKVNDVLANHKTVVYCPACLDEVPPISSTMERQMGCPTFVTIGKGFDTQGYH